MRDLLDALAIRGVDVRSLRAPKLDPWRFDRRVLWDQVLLPAQVIRSGVTLLHAAAGTLPFVRTVPTVVTVHDMAWLRVQGHTRAYARNYFGSWMARAYRSASAVVVDSMFSRDEYLELSGDRRPPCVVYPGVDARYASIVRRPDPRPFALVVGTVERRKNLIRAIEAVASFPELGLISVGPPTPYVNDVRVRIDELGIRGRCNLRGYVDRTTLDDLYARATLALVPSRYEGFGYAVAEARCAGLPFIAAQGSSLSEIAGDSGTLVDADDAAGWTAAVAAILAGRPEAERRAAAGREAARTRFAWLTAAATLEAVYRNVLGA